MGRPRKPKPKQKPWNLFEPSRNERIQVKLMRGYGLTLEEISSLIVNPKTGQSIELAVLKRTFEHELRSGQAFVNCRVVEKLYKNATGNGPQAVTAQIWWTKARMGWRSTDRVEHDLAPGSNGVLLAPAGVLPSEWVNQQRAANLRRKPPKSSRTAEVAK